MKTMIGTALAVAGAALAVATAAPSPAACSLFPSDGGTKSICGTPNLQDTLTNARKNLRDNFNPQTAVDNLKKNLGSLGGGSSTP